MYQMNGRVVKWSVMVRLESDQKENMGTPMSGDKHESEIHTNKQDYRQVRFLGSTGFEKINERPI